MADKLKNIFHHLKSQDKLSSDSYEDFQQRMQDPKKLENVYAYLKSEQLVKSETVDVFKATMGLTDPKTDPKNTNPTFKDKTEHDAFHVKQLFEKTKGDKAALQQKYFEIADKDPAGAQAIIAAMGGIPEYTAPPKLAKTTTPTDWSNLVSSGPADSKKGGYRYDAGQGKPAKGSITKRRD